MAVAAMGRGDVVLGAEMLAHADRRGLLAGIEMDKTRDAALRELLLNPLLEAPDRHHAAIGAQQFLAAQLHGILPRRGGSGALCTRLALRGDGNLAYGAQPRRGRRGEDGDEGAQPAGPGTARVSEARLLGMGGTRRGADGGVRAWPDP